MFSGVLDLETARLRDVAFLSAIRMANEQIPASCDDGGFFFGYRVLVCDNIGVPGDFHPVLATYEKVHLSTRSRWCGSISATLSRCVVRSKCGRSVCFRGAANLKHLQSVCGRGLAAPKHHRAFSCMSSISYPQYRSLFATPNPMGLATLFTSAFQGTRIHSHFKGDGEAGPISSQLKSHSFNIPCARTERESHVLASRFLLRLPPCFGASAIPVLQPAKSLAWISTPQPAYCRTTLRRGCPEVRTDVALRSPQWRAAHENLKGKSRTN